MRTSMSSDPGRPPRSGRGKGLAAGLLTVCLLGAGAVSGPAAAATPERGAAATAVSVSVYSPLHVPLNKPAVAAKGTARGFPIGARVRLQRRMATGWLTVGTPKALPGNGTFQFKVTHTREGFQSYRVQAVSTARTLATSKTLTTHVHRFTAGRATRAATRPSTAGPSTARTAGASAALNGQLECFRFGNGTGMTTVHPPDMVAFGNSRVYWIPQMYYYDSAGQWQPVGTAKILYSSSTASGLVAAYWWDYETGNEVFSQSAIWNSGFYMAAYNYVSPGDVWYEHGWSPTSNGTGYCAV
jgi:hypothetical protein